MEHFNVNNLPLLVPAFSVHQVMFFAEAAMTALESQGHESGVLMETDGEYKQRVEVLWEGRVAGSGLREPRDFAEYGAAAVAFYLATKFSEYEVVEQSVIGSGFDYWLAYKSDHLDYDPSNFLNARLEVSGILKGSDREVNTRLKQKIRQVGTSDHLNIPAMIVIVEFSVPLAVIFLK